MESVREMEWSRRDTGRRTWGVGWPMDDSCVGGV